MTNLTACGRAAPCAGNQTNPCVLTAGHDGECRPRSLHHKYPPSLVDKWSMNDALAYLDVEVAMRARAEKDERQAIIAADVWRRRAEGLARIVCRLPSRPRTDYRGEIGLTWAEKADGSPMVPTPAWMAKQGDLLDDDAA